MKNDRDDIPTAKTANPALQADCANCFGVCCIALFFSRSDGFPIDKPAGQPCPNLQLDYRCSIHESLGDKGLKGCMAFDCFGAGQNVCQNSFAGQDWRTHPESAGTLFEAFLALRHLHEFLWYLSEALKVESAYSIHGQLRSAQEQTVLLTRLLPNELLALDVAAHRQKVNALLLKTSQMARTEVLRGQQAPRVQYKTLGSRTDLIGADLKKENLRAANLRGAYLIAADLRGADLHSTDLLGADFRDTDLRGADLSSSLFLTQMQINSAKGDSTTKIPSALKFPSHWKYADELHKT